MPRMKVVAIAGHRDITAFGDSGPTYLDVTVTLQDSTGRSAEMTVATKDHPKIGDEFDVEARFVISQELLR